MPADLGAAGRMTRIMLAGGHHIDVPMSEKQVESVIGGALQEGKPGVQVDLIAGTASFMLHQFVGTKPAPWRGEER